MNLQIYNTTQELSNVINNSNLPVGVVYYIIKDLYAQVAELYEQQVTQEAKDEQLKTQTPMNEPIEGFTKVQEENSSIGQE